MDAVNKILENLLLVDDSILSVAMVDMNGHTVSSKSKYHINNGFVSNQREDDYGVWIRATFAMIGQCAKTFGKVDTFVSFHQKVKLLVIPMSEMNALIVLIVPRSTSAEYIISKISELVICYKDHNSWKNNYKENDIIQDKRWLR
ncbi:MAG: hypothetical protein M3530_09555 [Thermoproteota archaeon]|nr:hypothetical protein [Thermoproteota archaeon]